MGIKLMLSSITFTSVNHVYSSAFFKQKKNTTTIQFIKRSNSKKNLCIITYKIIFISL